MARDARGRSGKLGESGTKPTTIRPLPPKTTADSTTGGIIMTRSRGLEPRRRTWRIVGLVGLCLLFTAPAIGQEQQSDRPAVIPHAQDRMPGPALGPEQALAAMTVPEGFRVELVASEPDLVNPVAMTFDERGRIWVTESLEYPRREPGPGRDRIKVLEDTDGDGRADEFTIFADGLNIPSGIAVGHGGVWVANSPDILFYPDADRDAVPDGPPEVVVTGFGRDDTHELPNSLTWGPDGWLYGWNGVFNQSKVTNRKGETLAFTCAIFRIHPKTRDFELFCEGTSNPWGLAINPVGDFFASACVIDHMWHLAEGAYYVRQGGPYPAYTWPAVSIVDHRHQKAAYCGVHYFDSPAYPPEYRDRLYFGNIHANAVNVDTLTSDGSSYRAEAAPDFLNANDAWFMPVVQKTGPDGSLYILDWYDRYHCYQDANRDPEGIDRLKGRLYRVRYGATPRRAGFDLGNSTDPELIALLGSPNVYDREIAGRLLNERIAADEAVPSTIPALQSIVSDPASPQKTRMHALWSLVGGGGLDADFHLGLLASRDEHLQAWGVRAAGNMGTVEPSIRERVAALASDESPVVRLQVAAAVGKIEGLDPIPLLIECASAGEPDELVRHVAWEALHPRLDRESEAARFVATVLPTTPEGQEGPTPPALGPIYSKALDRLIAVPEVSGMDLVFLVLAGWSAGDGAETSASTIETLAHAIREGRLDEDRLQVVREALGNLVQIHVAPDKILRSVPQNEAANALIQVEPKSVDADFLLLGASWGDPDALTSLRARFLDRKLAAEDRLEALDFLVANPTPELLEVATTTLANTEESADFRLKVLSALGDWNEPRVAEVLLGIFPKLDPEIQARVLDLLAQRPDWSRAMLGAVESGQLPKSTPRVEVLRKLQSSPDPEVVDQARELWGTARMGRDPGREQVVARIRAVLNDTPGDPLGGPAVFGKLCAQCHILQGAGQSVGPDLTGVGRNDYDLLLSNVFDPSLVIGAGYTATTVALTDGRVLSGLLVEDSPDRIALKLQGGTVEVIPRSQVEDRIASDVSLMPEGIEDQLTPTELADLFAYLVLDDPPAPEVPAGAEPGKK